METKDVKQFYEKKVSSSGNTYEYDRWFKTSQGRASYTATKNSLYRNCLPLIKEDDVLLEVGPGPGTWTKEIIANFSNLEYDVVDISEEMLKQARANLNNDARVNLIQSDILDFSPQKQYDFFFSSRFIEYVPDKGKVIVIVAQSLKPGGYGYIVTKTPQYNRFFRKSTPSAIHQGQISDKELKKLFEDNGFQVLKTINITSVFPLLRVGFLDRILTIVSEFLPMSIARIFSESYAIVFVKK